MIGSLRGTVVDRDGAELLVEVCGVGYRVQLVPAHAAGLRRDEEVFLHVHHHRREDAEVLFGFESLEARRVFETLITTHGVGPSLGMAILSVHSPAALCEIVAAGDASALCLVPGVGKKTAARMLVELGSSLGSSTVDLTTPAAGPAGSAVQPVRAEVREALVALGYTSEEAVRVTGELSEDADSGEMLRSALRRLAAS